ncbi:Polyadenylation and cleavage factor-like protein [Thalictrum thalictroides]|uniref:Polyadenylation and cleavage factor-like protein n=1 Tax=Thalictrum thalictroides TaxID=46969 RepID=A0A7J6VYP8_THATH|nr:Polyadenylation and cleavage factor-like protein [Thalictrum thalictroides]
MNHQNSSQSSSSSMILDRFRSLLNQREEQIAAEMISNDADDDNDVYNVLNTEDIVELYEIVLSDLTSNSKPVIGELTMIAKEHRNHAHGIAHAICNRVFEVPSEQKLSSLYLLDSIVKNVGCEYVRYFASRLPEMFCETYRQVHPKLHASMRRLFGTWSAIFPPSVLHKIDTELQFSAPLSHQSPDMNAFGCSGSPNTDHGIHVNPKYLEARHQFEHSVIENMRKTDPIDNNAHRLALGRKRKEMDASASTKRWSGASQKFHEGQNGRGFASSLQRYGRQSNIGYEQYDADLSDFTTSRAASQQLGSSGNLSHESSIITSEKLLSSNTKRRRLPSSPPRIWPARSLSPSNYEFTREDSLERVSPLHPSFAFKHSKLNAYDGKNDDFSIEYHPDNYNLNNGLKRQGPRELIDAYGNDERDTTANENPVKLERISVNGVFNKGDTRRWQNSEEDEYTWEEMSPTLVNHGSNDAVSSNLSLENLNKITSLGMRTPLNKPDLRGHNWDPSVTTAELGISILGPGGGSMIGGGTRHTTTQNQDFHYSKQPWMKKELSAQSSRSNSTSLSPASIVKFSSGRPQSPPKAPLAYPPVNMGTSHRSSLLTSLPQHEQMKDHVGLLDGHKPLMDQGLLPNQQAGLSTSNQEHHRQTAPLWPQVLQPQNVHETYIPSLPAQVSSSFITHPWNHGHAPILHGGALRSIPINQISRIPSSSVNLHRRPDTSFHAHEGPLPLPPVDSLPNSLKLGNTSQSIGPAASDLPASNAYSGLINSLMAQGLLSVAPSASAQDSVGVEFNPDLLKVRYESSIKALYGDLPRKCTTCGLRFKCQEMHRSHMDWHVTKNRASKNRKHKPSRRWFVSTSVWLSGAEAVGSDAVPGFWSKEIEVEEKDQKEIAVPADEHQNTCALCGEPFDDFYSDETEEWMYRDALYLNAPNGSTNMERSQLGPIVHAKCRSESEVIT